MEEAAMRRWSYLVLAMACLPACGDTGEGGSESESESEAESEDESACPGATPTLENCFRGIAFADCGGDDEPVLGCGVEGSSYGGCLWFTGGCVPKGFETGSCVPGEICEKGFANCPFFLFRRGEEPWDAERAMTLEVTVDSGFSASATAISCTGCGDNCGGQNVCVAEAADQAAGASLPGTLVITLYAAGKVGWTAEIEVKLDTLTARVCRIPFTDDGPSCGDPFGEPACASSGTLTLSSAPVSIDDLDGLSGAITATFDDGLEITGEFITPE
jgi:hypothetical protein